MSCENELISIDLKMLMILVTREGRSLAGTEIAAITAYDQKAQETGDEHLIKEKSEKRIGK